MGETGEEALTEHDTHPMPAAVDNCLISRSLSYSRAILAGRAFVLRRAYIAKDVITGMGVTARQITVHNEGKPYNKGERICREAGRVMPGDCRIDFGRQEEAMPELSVGNICQTVQCGVWQLKKREKKHET